MERILRTAQLSQFGGHHKILLLPFCDTHLGSLRGDFASLLTCPVSFKGGLPRSDSALLFNAQTPARFPPCTLSVCGNRRKHLCPVGKKAESANLRQLPSSSPFSVGRVNHRGQRQEACETFARQSCCRGHSFAALPNTSGENSKIIRIEGFSNLVLLCCLVTDLSVLKWVI